MVLAFMTLALLVIVAAAAACFLLLPLIPAIVTVVIGVPLVTWLANHFGSKEGVKISVRSGDVGLGHFTYFPSFGPAYQAAEATMPKTLLDLCAQE